MKEFQIDLVKAWQDYAAGKIDEKTLKGHSAGFGIYQQRDSKTMMRVRHPGGVVTAEGLRRLAAVMDRFAVGFAHLTTRQDVQLHGVKAADVPAALEELEANGFGFRGGGGDTFRNVLVSRDSGLHADTAFDVIPYARGVTKAFYGFDAAYRLPRKIKIGFADRVADRFLARVQDLGFVAKVVDGRRVFETYFAGGIGFKPRVGIKLFDALPASECVRVAMALTRLFNEKGCRTNRAHARIRFLREDLGDEALVQTLLGYYEVAKTDCPELAEGALVAETLPRLSFPADAQPCDDGFDRWRALCVTSLGDGRSSVRVMVPYGNFTADELRQFVAAFERFGAVRYQIVNTLDFVLAPVPDSQLAGVYNVLASDLRDRDYTARSLVGHISTCIGNTICKSGANDSPAFGKELALELDRLIAERPADALEIMKAALNDVRISGCPNSCTNQCAFRFGFVCKTTPNGRELVPYDSGCAEPPSLGGIKAAESKSISETARKIINNIVKGE